MQVHITLLRLVKCFYIRDKKIKFTSGDSLWVSPFLKHGFSGEGSIIKISNGECLDYQDISNK